MHKKIPPQYIPEYIAQQTALIKNRVWLLCIMALGAYFFTTVISVAVFPEEFNTQEILPAVFLLISAIFVLWLNRRAQSLDETTLNAYLFTALLLAIITKMNLIYYENPEWNSAIYVFIFIFVSYVIPFRPFETVIVAVMVVAAYTFFALFSQRLISGSDRVIIDFKSYFEGLIFIYTAFVLSFVIRKKETLREIENFILLKDVEAKSAQMQRELELATKIHKTLIPKSMSTDLADIAVLYQPVLYLGGDYAKFHFVKDDTLVFIICDVTGHGVSAALLVNRIHAEFEDLIKEGKEPGQLLRELNEFIIRDFGRINMYLSAFCGLLDFSKNRFVYSNHGHPTQYLYRVTDSSILYLGSQTTLLGLSLGQEEVYQHEMPFDRGDKILLFTDGVIETMNSRGEEFGRERLERFIRSNYAYTADRFNRQLLTDLNAFKADQFRDDIFVLTIDVKTPRST